MVRTALREPASDHEFPLTPRDFAFIVALVRAQSGIVLGPNKLNMVYSRLAPRLRRLGLTCFSDYCARLSAPEGKDEIAPLLNAITTNLTRFFREPHHFEHLAEKACAHWAQRGARHGERRIRLWSAGCSTGEEPYSIAITLMRHLPDAGRWDARILASDLDTDVLAKAAAGVYPSAAAEGFGTDAAASWFVRIEQGAAPAIAAQPALRRLITFKKLNLLGSWPMRGPFDAIFCRNVMIYFDKDTKAALIDRFAEILRPGGFLYLGHSESLLEQHDALRSCGRTLYQRI